MGYGEMDSSVMKTVCIVGGGNLAHVTIGRLSLLPDVCVRLMTNRPEKWHNDISVTTPDGSMISAHVDRISSDPGDVVPGSDIVLFCLPAFCVEEAVIKVAPFLEREMALGTVVGNTGFFIFCHRHLPANVRLFGFQRVPFVARVVEYGRSASLLGYRDELFLAAENFPDREAFRREIEYLFGEKTTLLDSFYEVTLSNSNPILHTGRLYTMWKNWDGRPFDRCPLFYGEWNDEASELEVRMDNEFFSLLAALKVNTSHIETLLTHYESDSPSGMTAKIRSIASLSTILSPMKQVEGGWVPDFESRYFTEDFPYGLKLIKDLSVANGIETPAIDEVLGWGMSCIGK